MERLSRSIRRSNANHINIAVARDTVEALLGGWRNAPDTSVAATATAADVPAVVLEELAQQCEKSARGVFHNGTFYLVADQHTSPAEVDSSA